ncbi:MAG: hypothetical protein E5W55_07215 [Mesorhizobium sp.]|nr:MAG: hypothetical protein E5W55_07215 [Mesorhizobium sp.]
MNGDLPSNSQKRGEMPLTLKEIVKRDPRSVPLSEYERIFSGYRFSREITEEFDIKERFLTAYRLRVFIYSSALVSIFNIFLGVFFIQVDGYSFKIIDSLLSFFWPFTASELAQFQKILDSGQFAGVKEQDFTLYARITGLTSLVWLGWLTWRVFRDSTDRGTYIPNINKSESAALKSKTYQMVVLFFGFSFAAFFIAALGITQQPSLFFPSIFDGVAVYTAKTGLLIASAYWLLGLSSFFISIRLRHKRKAQGDGGLNG